MLASREGHSAPVKLLLPAKAPVGQGDKYGNTTLMKASLYSQYEVVELLESWSQLTLVTNIMRTVVTSYLISS